MTAYVALLRAVNVGGTGTLPMAVLRTLCAGAGFDDARTCLASGNVVLRSALAADTVKARIQAALAAHMAAPVAVFVRTGTEMAEVVATNPFTDSPGNRVLVTFLDTSPPVDAIATAKHHRHERIALGAREIYVAYGEGMSASKLSMPAARAGTARNMNTVARLADMAAG